LTDTDQLSTYVSVGRYALPTWHWTGSILQMFINTDNQSLKHAVNRCVLSLHLNKCKMSASRTAAGRHSQKLNPNQQSKTKQN